MMRHTLAPRSVHIASVGPSLRALAARALRLQRARRAASASRYAMWSPAQYFSFAWRTSSSKGSSRSSRNARASGGSTACRTVNRFVHSAAVWLKSRMRASADRRRYHSWVSRHSGLDSGSSFGFGSEGEGARYSERGR